MLRSIHHHQNPSESSNLLFNHHSHRRHCQTSGAQFCLRPSNSEHSPARRPPRASTVTQDSSSDSSHRKRSAEAPASSTLSSSPTSSGSEYRLKRAASEPLPNDQAIKPKLTPPPLLPLSLKTVDSSPSSLSSSKLESTHMATTSCPSASSVDSPLIGFLPVEVYIYLGTLMEESDLIRLTCCSKSLRQALIQQPILWVQSLTLNLAMTDMTEKIKTLYLERIKSSHHPSSLFDPTLMKSLKKKTCLGRWMRSKVRSIRNLRLRKLAIRLYPPRFSLEPNLNKLIIIPDEPYWSTQLIAYNLKAIKELMHQSLDLEDQVSLWGLGMVEKQDRVAELTHEAQNLASQSPLDFSPSGLGILDIRLDGQFEPTLSSGHEAWLFSQTPWVKTLREYRLWIGYAFARIPSFSLVALSSWMPNLRTHEIKVGGFLHRTTVFQQLQIFRRQREGEGLILGGTDFNEMTPGVRSAQTAPSFIESMELDGLVLNLPPSPLILPHQFPRLRSIRLRSIGWGRMLFELLRRSCLTLESIELIDLCFDQEMQEDLPGDWTLNWQNDEEMSEVGSEDGQTTLKSPPINLVNLKELVLVGESTPHIWSLSGEWVQNPILRMPNLKRCVCDGIDLEEDEHALLDLADLAPRIKELTVKNCVLRDEIDLYHCIRCLPDLELLDLRMTEGITSNLINALALSAPNIRHLDVRGCPYVQITSVAKLVETIRDLSECERRIKSVGVDKPMKPNFDYEMAQTDSIKFELWQIYQAWCWLDFNDALLDVQEENQQLKNRKDKHRMSFYEGLGPEGDEEEDDEEEDGEEEEEEEGARELQGAAAEEEEEEVGEDDDDGGGGEILQSPTPTPLAATQTPAKALLVPKIKLTCRSNQPPPTPPPPPLRVYYPNEELIETSQDLIEPTDRSLLSSSDTSSSDCKA